MSDQTRGLVMATVLLAVLALWIFGLGYLAGVPLWVRLVAWAMALRGLTWLTRRFPARAQNQAERARQELRALLGNAR